jgi:glycolate oxidase FAD binding subunit
MTEATIGEWQERIRVASESRSPLRIRGGGTKDFYGQELSGDVLATGAYAGIVDYDPTELVITARAGTKLTEVDAAMRARDQMLAFEPPHFGSTTSGALTSSATLGGCVAAGLSGPRRPHGGAVRDLVLGVRILDGQAKDLSFGGRVMKNVAGFDVARLMTGALGTLGVLLEISLRCVPVPKAETTRVLTCKSVDAIRMANEWGGKPLPISATCFHDGVFSLRLSGAVPAVKAAGTKIGGEELDSAQAEAFWRGVRDHSHPHFAAAMNGHAALWRLSVKSTAPFADLGGAQLIEWGGALRWLLATDGGDPARLRSWAREHGGHATLFRAVDKTPGVFHPLPESISELHRRLKTVFDPASIFNPGRLYAGF